jgi:hypothetical protein
MARQRGDQIAQLIAEVERDAKNLRTAVCKRAQEAGVPKMLQKAASQLQKRAASAAAQVEKYVHELRMELETRPHAAKVRVPARSRDRRKARAKH